MQQGNHRLLGHCRRLERQKDLVMAQVQAMQDKWAEAESMRSHLQNEANTLRKTCEVCASMPVLRHPFMQGQSFQLCVTQRAVLLKQIHSGV